MVTKLSQIPHAESIERALEGGRLAQLIEDNIDTSEYQGPAPYPLEYRLARPLGPGELEVAEGVVHGKSYAAIIADRPNPMPDDGIYNEKAIPVALRRVREAVGLPGLPKGRRAQLARHLFCLGLITPSEQEKSERYLPPTSNVVLGLLSHGSTQEEIEEMTGIELKNKLPRIYKLTGGISDNFLGGPTLAAVTAAFDRGIFSTTPDMVMPPEYLLFTVPHLLRLDRLQEPA